MGVLAVGAGRGQRLRRLPGDAANAGDVQEEGAEGRSAAARRGAANEHEPRHAAVPDRRASASSRRSKGLSHPTTSIRGNLFGMIGMAIAVAHHGGADRQAAAARHDGAAGPRLGAGRPGRRRRLRRLSWPRRVEMTKMPELVAFMHSMIGLAAVFIAVAAVVEPQAFGIVAHRASSHPRRQPPRTVRSVPRSARSPSAAR